MGARITRRDFLNGVSVAVGGSIAGGLLPGLAMPGRAAAAAPQDKAGYYPPALTGLRGSHVGSFEVAHSLRDGSVWSQSGKITDTGERYDLVVVGGGISGLSAAYFYRARRRDARILILDNHDDFGGHAKRNEFQLGGRLALINGGTFQIDSPRPYSAVADGLLKELGIDPVALANKCADRDFYRSLGLGRGVFFDRETFGADKLLVAGGEASWTQLLAQSPLSPQAQSDIARIEEAKIDYLPGLSSAEKKSRLSKMSYRDFLLNVTKADPGVIAFYQARTHGEWGVGIDAVSALDVWAFGFPGFQGLELAPGSAPGMGYTAAGYADGASYTFHFPDGNASIARLLVRSLVPESLPGRSAEDVVSARLDYSRLDDPRSPARIRLGSTTVRVRNVGDPAASAEVEIAYMRAGELYAVRAGSCVLACYNMIIPYLCPELPRAAKGGAPVRGQGPAHLRERGPDELDVVQSLGHLAGLFARFIFFLALPQSGRRHRGVSQPAFPRRTGAGPDDAHAGCARLARARSAPGRAARYPEHELCDFRTQHSRPIGAHPWPRRVRPRKRYHGDHRQPLAARLRLRIQSAV